MKKFGIVVLFSLIAVSFSFSQAALTSSSASDTLALQATISKLATIDITPTAAATFELLQNGLATTKVAEALINTNFNNWQVQVWSANGSTLNRISVVGDDSTAVAAGVDTQPPTAEVTTKIPYTFDFIQQAGTAHAWTGSFITLPSSVPTSGTGFYSQTKKTIKAGEAVDMNIAIDANASANYWDSGIYTDTIHVTISTL